MASSRQSRVTIEDLPDDVLDRVFVLAGQRFCPAIVGVSKRWWRVCWDSQDMWRHLTISGFQAEPPIVTPAPPAAADAGQLLPFEDFQQRQQQRMQACRAAKWALLQRVGRLAEAVTIYHDDSTAQIAPVAAMLQQLSPEALAELVLHTPQLEQEHAQLLAGFTRLHSLAIHTPRGCGHAGAILGQLPQLQSLALAEYRMGPQLVAAVLPLTGLTRLDLGSAYFPSLLGLTKLQQLHHFSVDAWDREGQSDEPTQLPAPASFAALQSYRSSGAYVYGGLQLAGFRFQQLDFKPLPNEQGGPAAQSTTHGQPALAQPGVLHIDGCATELGAEQIADEEAPGGLAPLLPQLNTLLVVALPPRSILRQLVLECYELGAVSLQRLPVLASLQRLEVRQCWGTGSMDGPLQALVQRAPALTSLEFDAHMPDQQQHLVYRLRTWPAYLLAHPSLRSASLVNRHEAHWDLDQAMPPSTAAGEPVLEHLTTDGCASIPPQLAAVTSLRSLDVLAKTDAAHFELTPGGLSTLLALPRLTSLSLPRLSEGGQQVAEQLRSARPGLSVRIGEGRCTEWPLG